MRPTKLTTQLLDAFRSVIADEWAALAFTEEELVWQANQRLPQTERITYRTYQRYKADILYMEEVGDDGTERDTDADDMAYTQLVQGMHETLKDALMVQKKALVRGVGEGQTNWRRFAWLLERKFPDFRLKPLAAVLGKQSKPTAETREDKKAMEKAEIEAERQASREAFEAKLAAEKAEHIERMKDPVYKWKTRGCQPWTPFPENSNYSIRPHELKALEEELARDVAAGYQDPYAHLGYRPDPVERTDGIYVIIGMGRDRLPLRVHLYRFADEPNAEQSEELWLKQEQERRNIIRAEQGLPPENLPEPPTDPDQPAEGHLRRGRGIIYGASGG